MDANVEQNVEHSLSGLCTLRSNSVPLADTQLTKTWQQSRQHAVPREIEYVIRTTVLLDYNFVQAFANNTYVGAKKMFTPHYLIARNKRIRSYNLGILFF